MISDFNNVIKVYFSQYHTEMNELSQIIYVSITMTCAWILIILCKNRHDMTEIIVNMVALIRLVHAL